MATLEDFGSPLTESHRDLRGELIRLQADVEEADFVTSALKDNMLGLVGMYRHQVELSIHQVANCSLASAIEARDEAEALAQAMRKTKIGPMSRLDSIESLVLSTLEDVANNQCSCRFKGTF